MATELAKRQRLNENDPADTSTESKTRGLASSASSGRATNENARVVSPLEAAIAAPKVAPFVADCLLDVELTALMRASAGLAALLDDRGTSRVAPSHTEAPLVWWTRYRRQYECWDAYVDRKQTNSNGNVVAAAADHRRRRDPAYELRIKTIADAAWRYTCDNWQLVGRARRHRSWYEQYRSYMIASMGVATRFALVDCDTHRLHCWLPYETWHEAHADRGVGERRNAAMNRVAQRGVAAQRWVDRHRYAYEPVDERHGDQKIRAPATSSLSSDSPYPIAHATYLLPERRARLPHATFVYAPNRLHARNANACRYADAVEHIGIEQKLIEATRLALAGTAFCVHAVHVYGVEYRLAHADIEASHVGSIADVHRACASWPSSSLSSPPPPPPSGASTKGDSDGTGCVGDGGDDRRDLARQVARMNAYFERETVADRKPIERLRRDSPRQADMSARWGEASRDWPISHNLCSRRVSALHLSQLYTRGLQFEKAAASSSSSSSSSDSAVAAAVDDDAKRELRGAADRGDTENGGGDGDGVARRSERVSHSDWLVVEKRSHDAGGSRLGDARWVEHWSQNFFAMGRAEALRAIAADEVRNCRRPRVLMHLVVADLMRAVQHAVDDELVTRMQDFGRQVHFSHLRSPLLPLAMFRDGRAWLPFDYVVRDLVCGMCGRRRRECRGGFATYFPDADDYHCDECRWERARLDTERHTAPWGPDAAVAEAPAETIATDLRQRFAAQPESFAAPATLDAIRRREAIRETRRNWCAPIRAADVFVDGIGLRHNPVSTVTDGAFCGLAVYR